MPRGRRYKKPEQSFIGNHSMDELAAAATPEEYKEDPVVVDEPTIGDLQVGMDGEPARYLVSPNERILVSDSPFEGQTPDPSDTFIPLGKVAKAVVGRVTAVVSPLPPLPDQVTYRQRIQILEVYRYPGHLKEAPLWIDRNWIVFFTYDEAHPERKPGPGLRVPGVGDVHLGDFLVQQEVALDETTSDVRMAVYTPEEFFRWFIPTRGESA